MILAKFKKKISQMQNLGQLGPKNCVFFNSSPDLNLHLYSPYCTISVSKIQNFQLLRGHTPPTPPFVRKRAIGADAPPNHPPMSKTDVQPCEFWCISCCKMFGRRVMAQFLIAIFFFSYT